jgi:hypothetical protein
MLYIPDPDERTKGSQQNASPGAMQAVTAASGGNGTIAALEAASRTVSHPRGKKRAIAPLQKCGALHLQD